MFSKEDILKRLTTSCFGRKLFLFETIDSTNACAKTLAEAGVEEGATVVADYQSNGRGRLGRPWQSEPGENLLASVVIRPPIERENSSYITFYAAVAIAKAIESVTGRAVECKWPNDILLNRKKVCGILVENSFHHDRLEFSIVGFGINVNQRSFPTPLDQTATSLAQTFGRSFDRVELLRHILENLDELYHELQRWDFTAILNEWNRRCTMFGNHVTVTTPGQTVSGTAVRVQEDGSLLIHTQSGDLAVYAGDVTMLSQQKG